MLMNIMKVILQPNYNLINMNMINCALRSIIELITKSNQFSIY